MDSHAWKTMQYQQQQQQLHHHQSNHHLHHQQQQPQPHESQSPVLFTQAQIETCIVRGLSKWEVICEVEQNFQLNRALIIDVWNKLVAQNEDFFHTYDQFYRLRDQLRDFNEIMHVVQTHSLSPSAFDSYGGNSGGGGGSSSSSNNNNGINNNNSNYATHQQQQPQFAPPPPPPQLQQQQQQHPHRSSTSSRHSHHQQQQQPQRQSAYPSENLASYGDSVVVGNGAVSPQPPSSAATNMATAPLTNVSTRHHASGVVNHSTRTSAPLESGNSANNGNQPEVHSSWLADLFSKNAAPNPAASEYYSNFAATAPQIDAPSSKTSAPSAPTPSFGN